MLFSLLGGITIYRQQCDYKCGQTFSSGRLSVPFSPVLPSSAGGVRPGGGEGRVVGADIEPDENEWHIIIVRQNLLKFRQKTISCITYYKCAQNCDKNC